MPLRAFSQIRVAHRDYRAISVVLDNFSSRRSASLQAVAERLDIALVYLPPYAPYLNPIEFLWKSLKRSVSVTGAPSLDGLKQCIPNTSKELTITRSCAKHWIEQFVPFVVTYKLT
jgi:putative transposase